MNQDQVLCREPEFVWVPDRQWWSACVYCHRAAWAHEQSDPLQDLRNYIELARSGLPPGSFSPTMRPLNPRQTQA